MNTTPSLRNRRGKLRLKRSDILNMIEQPTTKLSEGLRDLFSRLIIVGVDAMSYYHLGVLEYTAHSQHFDELGPLEVIPIYELIVASDQVFTRSQENKHRYWYSVHGLPVGFARK